MTLEVKVRNNNVEKAIRQLKKKVMKDGMRNSNVMAIAPTATISNITGVTQSIEPTYQNLYVKSNLSGEFTIVNTCFAKLIKFKAGVLPK